MGKQVFPRITWRCHTYLPFSPFVGTSYPPLRIGTIERAGLCSGTELDKIRPLVVLVWESKYELLDDVVSIDNDFFALTGQLIVSVGKLFDTSVRATSFPSNDVEMAYIYSRFSLFIRRNYPRRRLGRHDRYCRFGADDLTNKDFNLLSVSIGTWMTGRCFLNK